MRVAVLIDTWFPFIGGGQVNAYEISRRITRDDVYIDIITRNNGKDDLKLPKNLRIIKLGSKSEPNSYIAKILFTLRAFLYIYKRDYDLVHAHAFLPGITARLVSVTKGIPAVLTVHGTSINTKLNNVFSRKLEKFILTEILFSAQITVSQDFLKVKNINRETGIVSEALPSALFRVKLQSGEEILAYLAGKMRLHRIKVLIGDRVEVEIDQYGGRGRITRRF